MTTLRDAIKILHDQAETNPFAKLLLSGDITTPVYIDYLFNMYQVYQCLEDLCEDNGLLTGFEGIKRASLIKQDLDELTHNETNGLRQATVEYTDYLMALSKREPRLLLAHLYVRHFGDLHGGQIIKKKIPGQGTMYVFENRTELIAKVRSVLTDDLGQEACTAMEFAIKMFNELADEHNIQ